MLYVAYAAVKLGIDVIDYEKDEWHFIKKIGDIEYRWRLTSDLVYEVVAGLYADKQNALRCAKQIYVALLYSVYRKNISIQDAGCSSYCKRFYLGEQLDGDEKAFFANEEFFFSTKKNQGPFLGPGVCEVKSEIEEFSEYNDIKMTFGGAITKVNLSMDNIDEYCFLYSEFSQQYLYTFSQADRASGVGLQMTLLCGLLEKMAEDYRKQYKELEVVEEINHLIQYVEESSLQDGQKTSLINGLNGLKEKSAREKCRLLCKEYARPQNGNYPTRTIVNSAYRIRSAYSHGNEKTNSFSSPALFMKYVVLDVLKGYMQSVEQKKRGSLGRI